ncbi:hypothetical protein B0A49_09677 [Cryomyces minteri]|uniref:Rrn9 domain-containing protein n=1 Tax=Cryomyces minteri TaxID=331657 RepID=A0A4U0WRJ8_9PEZI|nr:hypothetical protein B0A49_09677 [Cryomyces minteri]
MSLFGDDTTASNSPEPSAPNPSVHRPSLRDARALHDAGPTSNNGMNAAADINTATGQGDSDYEDDEELEDTEIRPNRFIGYKSTWLKHTIKERRLISSMTNSRADDLSVHLYNAHALKAKLYSPESIAETQSWQNKERWIGGVGGDVKTKPWYPGRMWTAWPLEPEVVPRVGEQFGVPKIEEAIDRWTMRRETSGMPSEDLEDSVMASVLRQAKERFEERDWEGEGTSETKSDVIRGPVQEDERLKAEEPEESWRGSAWSTASRRSSVPQTRTRPRAPSLQSDDSASRALVSDDLTDPNSPRRSDEEIPFDDLDNAADDDGQPSTPHALYEDLPKPVIMADDEKARRILQPSIRHILTEFDGLLSGLHRARRSHYNYNDSDDSEANTFRGVRIRKRGRKSEAKVPDNGETSTSEKVGHSRSAKRIRNAGSDSGSVYTNDSDSTTTLQSPSPSSSAAPSLGDQQTPRYERARRMREIGLRDWSDVVGMASIIGWNPKIIDRAARRCASLFGEGMSFRTLHEGGRMACEAQPVEYLPDMIPPLKSLVEHEDQNLRRASVSDRAFLDADTLSCPHRDCLKHNKIFPQRFRLVQHIQRAHKYDPRLEPEMDEMYGGVHVDGYLRPVEAKVGWRGEDVEPRKRRKGAELVAAKERPKRDYRAEYKRRVKKRNALPGEGAGKKRLKTKYPRLDEYIVDGYTIDYGRAEDP